MASTSRLDRLGELDRLIDNLEDRLTRLNRVAARASSAAPDTAGRIGDALTAALVEIAQRFRGGAKSIGGDVSHLGEDAVHLGQEALRRLAKDVERKPLIALAIAVGVGVLAAGLFARRG
jgi:ElaB/YqjD/DUF883 family membrane-anchored ribosome-binding protein